MRYLVLTLIFSCGILPVLAKEEVFTQNVHYYAIKNPPRAKLTPYVSVKEFFWYGCVHCFKFHPVFQKWQSKQPKDVQVTYIPTIWNGIMEKHARVFYVARNLGMLEMIGNAFYHALNVNRKKLHTDDAVIDFVVSLGVDREKFSKQYKSFGVMTHVRKAQSNTQQFGIASTPAVVVADRWLVSGAESYGQMLRIIDYLIKLERYPRR